MGMRVSAIGNHDFDDGVGQMLKLLTTTQGVQWVCANLEVK